MISPYTIEISDDRLAAVKAKVEAYDWSELPDAGGMRDTIFPSRRPGPSPTR